MKYWFKSIALAILPRFANKIRAANLLLDSRDSYLEATGWMRSFLYGTPCKSDVDSFVEHAHEVDVVVVDGRRRVACCEVAIRNMKPSAVLILDDSNRSKYEEVFTIAVKAGFKLIRFQGLKPTGHCIEETTVFYRMNNCFGL